MQKIQLPSSKSQSAMEYLMTYGWAILIIAIVMIALFQLGMFNGTNFAPHATAGACQVYKSAAGSSLAGQCNGEWPQFVGQFSGVRSYISTGNIHSMASFTLSFWIDPNQYPSSYKRIISLDNFVAPYSGWIVVGSSSGSTIYGALFTSSGTEFDTAFSNCVIPK